MERRRVEKGSHRRHITKEQSQLFIRKRWSGYMISEYMNRFTLFQNCNSLYVDLEA